MSSSSKSLASVYDPTFRQALASTEEALDREGDPHHRLPLCPSLQTELQVFGM